MKQYVLGFMFDDDGKEVVLIRKNRPEWQSGFLNGVGGKIEKDETALQAMIREYAEECGISTGAWEFYGEMLNNDFSVRCYRAFSTIHLKMARTRTDEKVVKRSVKSLFRCRAISNLHWLIPLALDRGTQNDVHGTRPEVFSVLYPNP